MGGEGGGGGGGGSNPTIGGPASMRKIPTQTPLSWTFGPRDCLLNKVHLRIHLILCTHQFGPGAGKVSLTRDPPL